MKPSRFLPLTISRRQVMQGLGIGVLACILCNCYFLYSYGQANRALYYISPGQRILRPDATMPPFSSLLGISLYGCLAAALAMIPVVWAFWNSHTMGSKSIYTMRRLPNRWELHRRCITIPALAAVGFLLLAVALWGIDFAIYWNYTPPSCLPPSMWEALWN